MIRTVASDEDVQFLWALISCDVHQEEQAIILLKDIISLWLTIRGFSVAAAWSEEHKRKTKTNTRKSKALRKGLRKKIQTKAKIQFDSASMHNIVL